MPPNDRSVLTQVQMATKMYGTGKMNSVNFWNKTYEAIFRLSFFSHIFPVGADIC